MTNSLRAVFLDHASLDLGDLDLTPLCQLFGELVLHEQSAQADVVERLRGAPVAITNKVVIDADAMAALPDLRLILVSATGTNNVDLAAARQRGITVSNCRGYGTPSVAQHTLMLMLNLATAFLDYQRDVRQDRWQRRASSACWITPSSNWKARPSACSAMANWVARWRAWPKPSACACCWVRCPAAPTGPIACPWRTCCRRWTSSACTAH